MANAAPAGQRNLRLSVGTPQGRDIRLQAIGAESLRLDLHVELLRIDRLQVAQVGFLPG